MSKLSSCHPFYKYGITYCLSFLSSILIPSTFAEVFWDQVPFFYLDHEVCTIKGLGLSQESKMNKVISPLQMYSYLLLSFVF
jgi:hypothetical protein